MAEPADAPTIARTSAETAAAVLSAALARHGIPVHLGTDPPVPAGGMTAVLLAPQWTVAQLERLDARAPTLVVRQDGAVTLLGPVVGPGPGGCCLGCAEHARIRALELPGDPATLTFGGVPAPVTVPAIAALVADIARDPAASTGLVWMLRGSDGSVAAHRVTPRPGCAACDPLPDDGPDAARFEPVPRPLPNRRELRRPNPATAGAALADGVVDRRLGPVTHVLHTDGLTLPLVSAGLWTPAGREWGHGRAVTVAQARRTALYEAIERGLTARPHGRRTVLRASFAELGPDRAVDPATLGLPDPAFHDHPAFTLTPYSPDTPTTWVHGWSLTHRRVRAVPEHMAYYGVADAPCFVDRNSSGAGLGNSLEEAALYALYEVVERDAFLMAWYARTPLRRVAVPDAVTGHLADRLDALGYDLRLYDATNDLGVPVVLSLAVRRDDDPVTPHAHFAAGCHPDPTVALRGAAIDVAAAVHTVAAPVDGVAQRLDRRRLLAMLDDPTLVREMADHAALHMLPEARPRYAFLDVPGDRPVDWRARWPNAVPGAEDLTDVLMRLVGHLAALGLEVVVVDQTGRHVRDRLGLYAARVIVTGTLSLAFGHVNHRTRDLPRLRHVPHALGRLPTVPGYRDLPLHPHPFV